MANHDEHFPKRSRTDVIRVVLIDDHAAIHEALSKAIDATLGMELCGTAFTVEEAAEVVIRTEPDVAVVDLSLENRHGLEFVQSLRERHPDTQVVVYSMHDEQVYAERAIRAGAAGYVMKSASTRDVIEAIRRASRGELYFNASVALPSGFSSVRRRESGPEFAVDELTERERAVFELLGRGYSIERAAEELNVEVRTVDTHRRSIKDKLGLDSISELIQYAIRWHSAGAAD